MRFSISIGSYGLPQFLEMNLLACREVWGSIPILVYDGASRDSQKCKDLADRFDASFLTERVNRTHFLGCQMNSCCALAFARAKGCDGVIKQNQRLILLDRDAPEKIEAVFDDPKISLAMPPSVKPETILNDSSKFHHRFKFHPDFIAMRTADIDPQWVADSYQYQVNTDTSRHGALTENYWTHQIETTFKDNFVPLDWLSVPSNPPKYLRKIQHSEAQYAAEAKRLGMNSESFPTQEWSEILGSAYRPMAAFA